MKFMLHEATQENFIRDKILSELQIKLRKQFEIKSKYFGSTLFSKFQTFDWSPKVFDFVCKRDPLIKMAALNVLEELLKWQ